MDVSGCLQNGDHRLSEVVPGLVDKGGQTLDMTSSEKEGTS